MGWIFGRLSSEKARKDIEAYEAENKELDRTLGALEAERDDINNKISRHPTQEKQSERDKENIEMLSARLKEVNAEIKKHQKKKSSNDRNIGKLRKYIV